MIMVLLLTLMGLMLLIHLIVKQKVTGQAGDNEVKEV